MKSRISVILLPAAFALTGLLLSSVSPAEVTAAQQAMYERMLDFPPLVKGGRVAPLWLPDGNRFVYASQAGGQRTFLQVDPASGRRQPFFEEARLRAALAQAFGAPSIEQVTIPQGFSFADSGRAVRFEARGRWFELALQNYALRELPAAEVAQIERHQPRKVTVFHPYAVPDSHELPSADGQSFLRCQDYNLSVRHAVDDRVVPLTVDGVDRYGWCNNWNDPQPVWSPDGNVVAAFKEDAREVNYIPVVHWLQRHESVGYYQLTIAGGVLPQRTLHFIDVLSGEKTAVATGEDAAYFRPLGWRPDGREFLYFWLSRYGKRIELRAADRATGAVRVLWSEEMKTFVVATMEFNSRPLFQMLSDGRFIVASERSGWNHLYLYGPGRGKAGGITLLKTLTQGDFPVMDLLRVDERRGWVYFTAHSDPQRVYDTHLMRVRLDGGKSERLTQETGQHWIQFSPSGDYFLDTHSTVARPPVTQLRRVDGAEVMVLEKADISALTQLGWQPPEEFVVKAADGTTDLHGLLRKPWNFDPARRYPVIEAIYAGPQGSFIPKAFLDDDHGAQARALSQLGFIVVTVDGRGTPERSKAFQDVVYGNMGRYEIADHAAALRNAARTRPYMDLDRVGIYGISYGGYFTTRALLQAPDLYKVGVASSQVAGLDTVNAGAVENYMGGRPQDLPEPYAYASNLSLVNNLQGRLLIMHPTSDVNAPFMHAMQLVDALTRAGKPYDLAVLPEGNHVFEYRDSQEGGVFWKHRIRDYFIEQLQP